jgi:hypothetical protein
MMRRWRGRGRGRGRGSSKLLIRILGNNGSIRRGVYE